MTFVAPRAMMHPVTVNVFIAEDGELHAIRGDDGRTIDKGTVADVVIQAAIDDLPARGGQIQLPAGAQLYIEADIDCDKPVVLQGTRGWPTYGSGTEIIANNVAITDMVHFQSAFSELRWLTLNGNGIAFSGIRITALDCKVIGSAFNDCAYGAIVSGAGGHINIIENWLEGNGTGIYAADVDLLRVLHNVFGYNNAAAPNSDMQLGGSRIFIAHNSSYASRSFVQGIGDIDGLTSHDNNIRRTDADTPDYMFAEDLINSVISKDIANGLAVSPYYLGTTGGKTVSNVKVAHSRVYGHVTGVFNEAATGRVKKIHIDGYNPLGNIATPYPAGAGNLDDAAAAQAFPANNVDYTVVSSPKFITIYGGVVTSISIDGVITGLTEGSFTLNPEQVFKVIWTGQPSSSVYAI